MINNKIKVMSISAIISAFLYEVLIGVGYTIFKVIIDKSVLDVVDLIILFIMFLTLYFREYGVAQKIMAVCHENAVRKCQVSTNTYNVLKSLMICVCFMFIGVLWRYLEVKLTAIDESTIDTILGIVYAYIAGDAIVDRCFIYYEKPTI